MSLKQEEGGVVFKIDAVFQLYNSSGDKNPMTVDTVYSQLE